MCSMLAVFIVCAVFFISSSLKIHILTCNLSKFTRQHMNQISGRFICKKVNFCVYLYRYITSEIFIRAKCIWLFLCSTKPFICIKLKLFPLSYRTISEWDRQVYVCFFIRHFLKNYFKFTTAGEWNIFQFMSDKLAENNICQNRRLSL